MAPELSMSPCPPEVPASFKELYDQTVAFVSRTLRRYGIRDAGLDDAVQDVYLIVYRRLDTFEGRSALSTWLYGIARRVAAHHRRKPPLASAEPECLKELVDAEEIGPFESVARSEAEDLLCRLVGEIPRDRREVFVLAEIESLSGPEIAACLDLPLETVYWRLRVARAEFDRALERFEARQEWEQRRSELLRTDERASRRSWMSLLLFLGADPARPPAAALAGSAVGAKVGLAVVLGAALAVGGAFALGRSSGAHGAVLPTATASLSGGEAEPVLRSGSPEPRLEGAAAPAPARAAEPVLRSGSPEPRLEGAPAPAVARAAEPVLRSGSPEPRLEGAPAATASLSGVAAEPALRSGSPEPRLEGAPVAAPSRPSIGEEARLLLRADRAIRAEKYALARSLIESHQREFERGQLRRERQALAIAIDCLSGVGDSEARRRDLEGRYRDAAISDALRRACQRSSEGEAN